MRLLIIVGLSAALVYFITGGFKKSDPPRKSAEWNRRSLTSRLPPLELPIPVSLSDALVTDSLGVVTLGYTGETNDHWLRLYNEDGSLWYEFTFYDAGADYDEIGRKLRPFGLHPDYFILALRCVGVEKDRWRVLVDESSGLTKFIKKDDRAFLFQTWGEYTRDAGCVDLNQKNNPVRRAPNGEEIKFPGEDFLPASRSLAVSGDWLKIQWESQTYQGRESRGTKIAGGSGWIRWLKEGRILIDFGVCC